MPNWVETTETAMEDCPSAEELEKEKEKHGKLDTEVPDSNSHSQS